MRDKNLSLHSNFSVNGELSSDDTRFLSVTIDVMHTGENLNGSFFEKSVVDSCVDSIKNTPVLGFVKYDDIAVEYDFGGHEYVTELTEGGISQKYVGSAYGVIPESCNPRWFVKMCDDGHEREFLQVDALLWTKFDDSSDIIMRDSEKAQSMELSISSIEGEEDENGIFHFSKFKFDGCCILGDDKTPAMTGANIKVNDVEFSTDGIDKAIREELNDKFTTFSKLVNEKDIQGGVGNMTKLDTDFAQTVLQQFNDISNIVSQYETVRDRWGYDTPRFSAVDIQGEEVIVVDAKDSYNYYGLPFSMSGDKPEIDFAGCKRKKVSYEDYDESEAKLDGAFDFGEHISHVEDEAFAKVEEAESKAAQAESKLEECESAKAEVEAEYEKIKSEFDEIKPKYDEYVRAEEQRIADELNAQKDAKFSEYEDALSNSADFAALKERKDEMSAEEIEKECALLYAKANLAKSGFSATDSTVATVGVISDGDGIMDGYVHTKYGNVRISR